MKAGLLSGDDQTTLRLLGVGHDWGLDHNDESGADLNTCMDHADVHDCGLEFSGSTFFLIL